LLRQQWVRRREVLADLCRKLDAVDVHFSAGVIGAVARPAHRRQNPPSAPVRRNESLIWMKRRL
jgi:hypothetical protein